MNLIHFQGLNCYQDCIISIVDYFGLNYPEAFATLWSETDFSYDPRHNVYLTKRILTNLDALGAKVETVDCPSPEMTAENLGLLCEGEFIIVGMDAFYVPWSPFYQALHDSHYFIIKNAKTEELLCFDPTYNEENVHIDRREIIAHIFAICRVDRVAEKPLRMEAISEAREIITTHPNTRSILLSRLHDCVNARQKKIILLAKYIDTMINNRYLYWFFLESQSLPANENHFFSNSDIFMEWKAVKNGLYKAAISRSNELIIAEVCDHFNQLIDKEIDAAEKILMDQSFHD